MTTALEAIDGFTTGGRSFRLGERVDSDDPIVQTHRALFIRADASDEAKSAARAAWVAKALDRVGAEDRPEAVIAASPWPTPRKRR